MINRKPGAILFLLLMLIPVVSMAASSELKPYKGKLSNPDFTLQDTQGNDVSLSSLRGNVVLVQFWATYCTPCRKEMPSMNRLQAQLKGQPFKILAINMGEEADTVNKFLQEVPVDFSVLLDSNGKILGQWKVYAVPSSFLIGKNGNILYTLYGAIDWDEPKVVSLISSLASD